MQGGRPVEPLPYVLDSFFCPLDEMKEEAEKAAREDGRNNLHFFFRRRTEEDKDLP